MAKRQTSRPAVGVPAGELIFIGPPGVGKGTQAKRLMSATGWKQLSTGERFRDHLRRETALGRLARSYIDKGDYVPDDITVGLVREFIDELPAGTKVMFDGFPRTVAQARALDDLLAERGRSIWRVLVLDAPRDELERRILARSRAEGRTDDTPEVIGRRFDVYAEQTRPVVDYYDRKGVVQHVDGAGGIDEVAARLIEAAR